MLTTLVLSIAGAVSGLDAEPATTTMTAPAAAAAAATMPRGETPPPGPPWLLTYREARRDALLRGRPVMVYFTKTY